MGAIYIKCLQLHVLSKARFSPCCDWALLTSPNQNARVWIDTYAKHHFRPKMGVGITIRLGLEQMTNVSCQAAGHLVHSALQGPSDDLVL